MRQSERVQDPPNLALEKIEAYERLLQRRVPPEHEAARQHLLHQLRAVKETGDRDLAAVELPRIHREMQVVVFPDAKGRARELNGQDVVRGTNKEIRGRVIGVTRDQKNIIVSCGGRAFTSSPYSWEAVEKE